MESIKAGPFFIVSFDAKVAKIMKFSVISSENKLVTLLKIYYLVVISNLFVFDLEIKQTVLICLITFENTYLKASLIILSYSKPLVSP